MFKNSILSLIIACLLGTVAWQFHARLDLLEALAEAEKRGDDAEKVIQIERARHEHQKRELVRLEKLAADRTKKVEF
jgi:hypothetical protein